MSHELASLGLTEAARLVQRKKVSAVELTRACIGRIDDWQPRINCFIEVERDGALKAARRLDAIMAKDGPVGPLHGVPLAHKDMFYRKGRICSAGSAIRRDWIAPYSSTLMERLEAAGAICLGRLNMAEFAADATGYNKHFGRCGNPWSLAHIAGGSSSGSGAAVAARLVFGALGSDTGGSIRLPAAANGVVGLMPSYGRVSRYGAVPRAWTLDHVGPLARTAADCARLLRVIAGPDPRDGNCSRAPVPNYEAALRTGAKGLRIGIPEAFYYDDVTPEIRVALDRSLAVFKSLGAKLLPVKLPDPAPIHRLCEIIVRAEAATMHGRWLRERPDDYSQPLRRRLEGGFVLPATWYVEALILRGRALAELLDGALRKIDLLHCPVMPHAVPSCEAFDYDTTDPAVMARMAGLAKLTRPFNFLGLPTVSVPCGFTGNGLPTAFQLAGRPFDEAVILRAAHAYQQATDWHLRVPTPSPSDERAVSAA